ncbi:MAG: cupin domain-containing protein, partial [Acidobacteria bacterium]|nr:cupin domain-containing protein [Acidobacteriota bacterium]
SYTHVKGWPGKFAHLLPWHELNEILRRHRLDFPRLRLMRDGQRVPVNSFIRHATSARRQSSIPKLLPEALTKHLREGATLVLDAVDELYRPIEELAEGLEFIFREHVQVNMYAGWQTSRGFDLHWDDHDVFILQVTGRKLWRIYGETRPSPVTGDEAEKPLNVEAPLWEAMLEDGDLLYIPRGCWHVALPQQEPTLHLTVGIHNRTGLDLMSWLSQGLRENTLFRQDLPRFASSEERRAHMLKLREELLNSFSDDSLERFLSEHDERANPRAHLSLPWSATHEILPEGYARVRLLAPRPLSLRVEGGALEFSCMKKRWRFAADAALVLEPLMERRVCSVAELVEAARGALSEERVRKFLAELVEHGLVAVVED